MVRKGRGEERLPQVWAFVCTVKNGNAFSVHTLACAHRHISLWKGEQMTHAAGNGIWSSALAREER